MSALRDVCVDQDTRTVRAGVGATWGDLDRATQRYGLAVPGRVVSSTGVAGLTLSGSLSWRRRELVTADGSLIHASATENPDLLWALKGGGGNFGVVTAFEFGRTPRPDVYATQVVYPFEQAPQVLAAWLDALAPAAIEGWANFATQRNAIETRALRHTGTAVAPRRP